MNALATLDPTNPNNWADTAATYRVVVRPPRKGEWFLTGAKLTFASKDYFTAAPVIVGIN